MKFPTQEFSMSSREASISQEIERDSDQVKDLGFEFQGQNI